MLLLLVNTIIRVYFSMHNFTKQVRQVILPLLLILSTFSIINASPPYQSEEILHYLDVYGTEYVEGNGVVEYLFNGYADDTISIECSGCLGGLKLTPPDGDTMWRRDLMFGGSEYIWEVTLEMDGVYLLEVEYELSYTRETFICEHERTGLRVTRDAYCASLEAVIERRVETTVGEGEVFTSLSIIDGVSPVGRAILINIQGVQTSNDGNTEEALELYLEASELDPMNYYASTNVGNMLISLRRYDEALEYYMQSLDASPDYSTAILGTARSHYFMGGYQTAIDIISTSIEADTLSTYKLSDFYYWRATNYLGLGLYEYSIEDLEQSLANNPDSTSRRARLAKLTILTDNFENAESYYAQSIIDDPTYSTGFLYMGILNLMAGDNDEALDYLDNVISLGDASYAQFWRGAILSNMGQDAEMESAFNEARSLAESDDTISNNRILTLTALFEGDIETAMQIYEENILSIAPLPHNQFTTFVYLAALQRSFPEHDDFQIFEEWLIQKTQEAVPQ